MGAHEVSVQLRQAAAGESSVFYWVRACQAVDQARESASTRSGQAWESLSSALGQVRRDISACAGDPSAVPGTRSKLMALADRFDTTVQ